MYQSVFRYETKFFITKVGPTSSNFALRGYPLLFNLYRNIVLSLSLSPLPVEIIVVIIIRRFLIVVIDIVNNLFRRNIPRPRIVSVKRLI